MNMFKERKLISLNSSIRTPSIILYGARIQYRNADSAYAFRQDSNFWYLSGFNEADSVMLIIKDIEQQIRSMIFVPPKIKLEKSGMVIAVAQMVLSTTLALIRHMKIQS